MKLNPHQRLAEMPPSLFHTVFWRQYAVDNATTANSTAYTLAGQWSNPADILSVLLLLGPDIVHRAIAQLTGRVVTPVAFSFGWVTYSITSLMRIFGGKATPVHYPNPLSKHVERKNADSRASQDGRLMPEADVTNTLVIGSNSGHSRLSNSWVLGRLLRDANDRTDKEVSDEKAHQRPIYVAPSNQTKRKPATPTPTTNITNPSSRHPRGMQSGWEALRVTVYQFDRLPPHPHGVPTTDLLWWSGFGVMVVELAISLIPCILEQDWAPFLLTSFGNMLALIGSSLPQWREEKWACPRNGGDTVTVTEGNGSRHALLILGRRGIGLDLEILARGTRRSKSSMLTKLTSIFLTILWICHLIAVAGLKQNTWYMLAIGFLGGAQNLYVAGSARKPDAMGFHLEHIDTIRGNRVAQVLKQVEERYPMSGTSLIDVFYPGSLRVRDDDPDLQFWRDALNARYAPSKHGTCVETKIFK